MTDPLWGLYQNYLEMVKDVFEYYPSFEEYKEMRHLMQGVLAVVDAERIVEHFAKGNS